MFFQNRSCYNISRELATDTEGFIFLEKVINYFNETSFIVEDIINDVFEDFNNLDDAVEFFNSIVDQKSMIRL